MRCIFCKSCSDASKSVEHIIPASLGNEDHILPPGWVCDACNNYLSREVEAPFLNSGYGQCARAEMYIPTRRGRFLPYQGYHMETGIEAELQHEDGGFFVLAIRKEDSGRWIAASERLNGGNLIFPASGDAEPSYEMARFVGKVGLEVLALCLKDYELPNEELAGKAELDELRHYVRRGKRGSVWPVHCRRLYPADQKFADSVADGYQMLHEFDILVIPADHPAPFPSGRQSTAE